MKTVLVALAVVALASTPLAIAGSPFDSPTGKRKLLDVVADRFRLRSVDKQRVVEAIEASLKRGGGRVNIYVLPASAESTESQAAARLCRS